MQNGDEKLKRSQHEFRIHVAIVSHIESAFPQILFTHAAHGHDETHAHFLSRMGYQAGTPDLLLFWDKKFAGLEVKAATSQSPVQKTFEYLFVRAGGLYAVCHSVREAHDALVGWGGDCRHAAIVEPDLRSDSEKKRDAFNLYRP